MTTSRFFNGSEPEKLWKCCFVGAMTIRVPDYTGRVGVNTDQIIEYLL